MTDGAPLILPDDPERPLDGEAPGPGPDPARPDADGAPADVDGRSSDVAGASSDVAGGSHEDPVTWTPFDPGDAPELPDSGSEAGRVVAVIASVELVGVGWAVSVATELARVWAERRPGVVLVDTDLARPRLHHAVRVDNAVGLAEVLRGEAPVANATRVVDEDRLFCVPAGNAPDDPRQGFDRARWSRLCDAFSGAGVTVVAYVPASAGWIVDVLDTATDVVVLADQHHRLDWPREGAPPLRAVLGPMPLLRPPADPTGRSRAGSTPLLGFDTDHEDDDHEDDLVATGGGRDDMEGGENEVGAVPSEPRDATNDGPPPGGGAPDAGMIRRSPRRGGAAGRRGPARSRAAALALVVVLALGGWAAIRLGTGAESPPPEGTGSPGAADTGGPASGPPSPVPPSADFSVAVASYTDAPRAEARRARLADAVPSLPWFVVPVEVDGGTYHRVVGGLVADSSAALALGAELAREGSGGIGDWIVRRTGWVLDFGEHPDRSAAERELARIREEGIPAQLAEVRFTDQTVRYRIYAGGYRDAAEAAHLGVVAEAAGLNARLARRLGRPPV